MTPADILNLATIAVSTSEHHVRASARLIDELLPHVDLERRQELQELARECEQALQALGRVQRDFATIQAAAGVPSRLPS